MNNGWRADLFRAAVDGQLHDLLQGLADQGDNDADDNDGSEDQNGSALNFNCLSRIVSEILLGSFLDRVERLVVIFTHD